MNNFRKKRNVILTIFLLVSGSFFAQTQDQAKKFINISYKGVHKIQKDFVMKKLNASAEPDFKKLAKYQFIAVKLYNQNKLSEAVFYAYKVRILVVELLGPADPMAKEKMKVTDNEKIFFDPAKAGDLKMNPKILNADDSKRIDDLDPSNYLEFRKLALDIPVGDE